MPAAAFSLAPVHQPYLLEARQMQALSFMVHIPLVCFGIAFPVTVLFVEWMYLRTGDELYLTLARRWSKVMVALFAVRVITGTILSFEMGLLWPTTRERLISALALGRRPAKPVMTIGIPVARCTRGESRPQRATSSLAAARRRPSTNADHRPAGDRWIVGAPAGS